MPCYLYRFLLCTSRSTFNFVVNLKVINEFWITKTAFYTAQKIKFFIKNFFSKCDEIGSFLQIWSHLPKKSLMENFIFCAMLLTYMSLKWVLVTTFWIEFVAQYKNPKTLNLSKYFKILNVLCPAVKDSS